MVKENSHWILYTVGVIVVVAAIVAVGIMWPRKPALAPPLITTTPLATSSPATPATPLVTLPIEPSKPEIPSPLTINSDNERGLDTIKHGSVVVGDIPNGWGAYETKVIRVTDTAVYLQSCRREVTGYLLFGVCPRRIYRVTLATNELRNVVSGSRGNIDLAEDISPKESYVALGCSDSDSKVSPLSVVVKLVEGKDPEQEFPVSSGYNQLGDLRFSPDGKKLAYAVAVGRPHDEAGAVFVVDIKTGAQTKIIETTNPNSYFRIKVWKDKDTVDYTEVGL